MACRTGLVLSATVAGLLVAGLHGEAAGQRIVPQVGLYVPVSDLGQIGGVDGAVDLGKKESSRAYGLGLEWGAGGSVGLRGNLVYATPSDVPLDGITCGTCASRSSMAAITGGVVLRPFRLFFIEPYFVGGVGLKRYDFSSSDFEEGFDLVLNDRTEKTYQFGVGGELGLGILHGVVEISDYVSRYEALGLGSKRHHDFIVTIGIAFGG